MKKSLIVKVLVLSSAIAGVLWISARLSSGERGDGCPFCRGEILKGQEVFRGREAVAILTYKPAVSGHFLVIPRRHVERFEELTPSEIAEMGQMLKKVDAAVKNLFHTTGSVLVQKNGREAGQSVPHVHFHYLPCAREGSPHLLFLRFFLSSFYRPLSPEEMAPLIADLQRDDTL